MNFRLTLVMVILLLIVGTIYFTVRSRELNPKPVENTVKNAVFSPQPKDLKSIGYTQDGDKQVAFAKSDNTWEMTYPATGPVNGYQLDPLADSLKSLTYKEKFEPEATGVHSTESTGTNKPRNVVTFTDDAGREHTLGLGKSTIGGIYATVDGSRTIYLLTYNPLDTLQQDPNSFRDRNIKQIAEDKITGLTIRHGKDTVTLGKTDGKWLIESPITARANHSTVDEIINEMKDIRATGFSDLSKDMPATGLHPPLVSVTALVEKPAPATQPSTTTPASQPAITKTPVTLELGYYTDITNKNAVYASLAGSNEVFTLSADSFKKLNRQLKDLRDPAITPSPVSNATRIQITHTAGEPTIDLKKENNAWQITSTTPPLKADAAAVRDLLTNIADLRAINFVDNAGDLKSIGLEPPQATIKLTIPGQSQQEVILMGKPQTAEKVTPFMRQGEPTVYLVQTGDAEKVLPTTLGLRDKEVASLTTNDIRSIEIAGPSAAAGGITLDREGSTWSVKQNGKSQKADDVKITSLLGDFSPLTAQKYLAESDKAQWHLPAKPDIAVTIHTLETTPATAPASQPAGLKNNTAGPMPSHSATYTLDLYKPGKGISEWRAVWNGGREPQWLFEPPTDLITHLTTTTYPAATTQPSH